jgi:amidase
VNVRAFGRLPRVVGGLGCGDGSGRCDLALGSDTGARCESGELLRRLRHSPDPWPYRMSGDIMAPTFDVAGWFASSPGSFAKWAQCCSMVHATFKGRPGARCPRCLTRPTKRLPMRCVHSRSAPHALPHPQDVTIAPEGFDAWRRFGTIQGREIWSIYGAWIKTHEPNLGPGIAERMAFAATATADERLPPGQGWQRRHIRGGSPQTVLCCRPRRAPLPEWMRTHKADAFAPVPWHSPASAFPASAGVDSAVTVDGCRLDFADRLGGSYRASTSLSNSRPIAARLESRAHKGYPWL